MVSSEPARKSHDILGTIGASCEKHDAKARIYVRGPSASRECAESNILVGFIAEDLLADTVWFTGIECLGPVIELKHHVESSSRAPKLTREVRVLGTSPAFEFEDIFAKDAFNDDTGTPVPLLLRRRRPLRVGLATDSDSECSSSAPFF